MPDETQNEFTIKQLLNAAMRSLRKKGIESSRTDAEILMAETLDIPRMQLPLRYNKHLSPDELKSFKRMLERRKTREPIQYILGWAPFIDLKIEMIPGVFIPRPETEGLAELCFNLLDGQNKPFIIETCAGTAAISFWLKSKIPDASVIAIERHSKPFNCLLANITHLGIEIEARQGNLLEPIIDDGVRGRVDLIVANPPYISSIEMAVLPFDILGWEPRTALHGGLAGTDFYPGIIDGAAILLKRGGYLAFEIGEGQGNNISERIDDTGYFKDIEVKNDMAGRARYVICKRNSVIESDYGL